jgi:hypothetical protein
MGGSLQMAPKISPSWARAPSGGRGQRRSGARWRLAAPASGMDAGVRMAEKTAGAAAFALFAAAGESA